MMAAACDVSAIVRAPGIASHLAKTRAACAMNAPFRYVGGGAQQWKKISAPYQSAAARTKTTATYMNIRRMSHSPSYSAEPAAETQ
jgi:hypothetical protein